VQALESVWVLLTVVWGWLAITNSRAHGVAFSRYIIAYGIGRFLFEFLRGDAARPYWAGLSQPQWISLFSMAGVAYAELAGRLPRQDVHLAVTVGMIGIAAMVAIASSLGWPPRFQLRHPQHISEIAHALRVLSPQGNRGLFQAQVSCTSMGVCFSGGSVSNGEPVRHYSISHRGQKMTRGTASVLARAVAQLSGARGPAEVIAGTGGVYHVHHVHHVHHVLLREGAVSQ
jgi:hypothetical protein